MQEVHDNIQSPLTNDLTYKKANALISGKYRSSIMENKILALGMAKATKEEGRAVAKLTAAELRFALGKTREGTSRVSGSFYTRLKDVATELTGRKIFVESHEKSSFAVINLVGSAIYKDNVLTIKFEPDLTDYILDVRRNYTKFSLPILMSFDKIYSYRLYELLKSKAYFSKLYFNEVHEYSSIYPLSELKLTLGVVDTNADAVSKALKRPNPDFDKIVNEISKEKNFNMWSDFKKKVIDPAIKEINEKSDLNVRYELLRSGYGGKIKQIAFYFNKKYEKKQDDMPVPSDLIKSVMEIIKEPITEANAATLLRTANCDINKIKRAYGVAQKQPEISNLMGWMLTAIRKNYGSEKDAKNFLDFLDTELV